MKTTVRRLAVVGLVLGLTTIVAAPSSAAAASASAGYQLLVRPQSSQGALSNPHEFTIELRTDGADADTALDDPLLGATVNLLWTPPAGTTGSAIIAIDGTPVGPTNSTSCVTGAPTPGLFGGICRVTISQPSDVGEGTLTATYALPNPGPTAPQFPSPDESTNCVNPQTNLTPGPRYGVIEGCDDYQDVYYVHREGVMTWVGYEVVVEPDGINPLGVEHTFTIDTFKVDGTSRVPVDVDVNFSWAGPAGSLVTHVDGVAAPNATICDTGPDFRCTVTVNSEVNPGTGTLTANSVVGVLIPPLNSQTEPTPSSDVVASKTWVDWRVLLVPPQDVNLLGDQHVFTATLQRDDGTGWVVDTTPNNNIDFTWSGVPGSTIVSVSAGEVLSPTTARCNTNAAGQCTVTVDTTAVGSGTLTATIVRVTLPGYAPPDGQPGALFDYDVPDVSGDKTWVRFFGDVRPTATNLVGEDHVFTIHVTHDKGLGVADVPNGSVVKYTWSGTGTIDPPSSCTTTNGRCTVVASSNSAGTGTIRLRSVTATIDGVTFTNAPLSAAASAGSLRADKTWIDYRLRVTPPNDTNLVDTEHVFTVLVERDAGNGFAPLRGATPTITRTGVGRITSNGCASGTAADGTCRVVTTSTVPGDMTVRARFVGAAGGETITLTDSGDKLWVNYRLTLTPREAINDVGDPHVFVAKLEVDRGNGFRNASGETLSLSATGVGSIIRIRPAGPRSGTCRTDNAGTCRITVNSNVPGSLQLNATYDAIVGSTSGTFTADAAKGWIPPEELPRTGGQTAPILRGGFGLLALGGVLLLASRRRWRLG